ncbi:hypothetical protein [Brevundimonas sp. Root1279]|uniref:hypothetical protein n=1 Tax=Brevundimonas sp. Root1279 TaxID=1736443 RepID=UPI0006F3B2F8|nr:hypothetical protein [Brevundimonas sp. Root1279]KQW84089.1 hypothetical protein ASC65_05630 [Brevundimonas sp. Root1279]
MIAHLALPVLLGVMTMASETPASERSPVTESVVTVVGVGSKPDFDSGLLMATILVLGQSSNGDVDPYYLIQLSRDAPVPTVGAQCRIWHSDMALEFVGGLEISEGLKGRVFGHFECNAAAKDAQ